jgi:hypothetical protein
MWYKFPKGLSGISVERQTFAPEFEDAEGNQYFRAPAHFSNKILGMGMGFTEVPVAPEGAPEDFPDIPPTQNQDLSAAVARASAFENDIQTLRTENSALNAKLGAAMHELEETKLKLHETATKLVNFKDDLEEEGVKIPPKVLKALEE